MRQLSAALTALVAFSPIVTNALPPSPTCEQTPPWRRLTNRIFSSIWRPLGPQNDHESNLDPFREARSAHSNPSAARYGQDIVLRFNITTAEEANALAEASDDLYLDVWEFNDNWVDIRLAKDVVSGSNDLIWTCPLTLRA